MNKFISKDLGRMQYQLIKEHLIFLKEKKIYQKMDQMLFYLNKMKKKNSLIKLTILEKLFLLKKEKRIMKITLNFYQKLSYPPIDFLIMLR